MIVYQNKQNYFTFTSFIIGKRKYSWCVFYGDGNVFSVNAHVQRMPSDTVRLPYLAPGSTHLTYVDRRKRFLFFHYWPRSWDKGYKLNMELELNEKDLKGSVERFMKLLVLNN